MPREPFCFSHHSGGFSLCMVDFYTETGCFLYLHRFPGTLSLCQAGIYLSRLISRTFFFSPDHSAPQWPVVYHPAAAQHAFERVTTQELFHHLCIAHFLHCFRFIHPRARYTCGSFSPHTRLARNPKYLTILKNFSGMCCFSLATRSSVVMRPSREAAIG
jgi:hypothetical protein